MKMSKSLFIAMAMAVVAWAQDEEVPQLPDPVPVAEPVAPAKIVRAKKVRPPYEHRGFFFSMGLGTSYLTTSVEETNSRISTSSGYTDSDGVFIRQNDYRSEKVLHEKFSGWALPIIDLRFGKSIGNMVALYSIFSTGIYQGEGSHLRKSQDVSRHYDRSGSLTSIDTMPKSANKKKDDAFAFLETFGLGLSIYPFRNPQSFLNGFYIGASGGVEAVDAHLDDSFSLISNGGIFTRFELGKDWWISETWSLGVGFAYVSVAIFENGSDKEENDRKSISFFIRLTHG